MKDVGNEICYEARHIAANMRIKPLLKVVIAVHSFIFTTINQFYEEGIHGISVGRYAVFGFLQQMHKVFKGK